MGPCKPSKANKAQGAQNVKEAVKHSNPWHKNSYLVRHKDQEYIESEYPIEEHGYKDWHSLTKNAMKYPNSSFHYLPHDANYVKPKDKNGTGHVVVQHPYYPLTLAEEIRRRRPQKAYFDEGQLYYLLYALIGVKHDSMAKGHLVGDIQPENVFISHDEKVKVATLNSFPHSKSAFERFTDKLKPHHDVYLAPEDLALASQNKLDNSINKHSQTFSIGATVLAAGLLDDLSSIYDYPNKAFRMDQHTQKTVEWLDHPCYSELFKSIVLSLLNPVPEKRISIEELWAFLQKYRDHIHKKEMFIVNNPPAMLENGVSIIRSKAH